MMDFSTFAFGFWAGACFIVCVWGVYHAGKNAPESKAKENKPRDYHKRL